MASQTKIVITHDKETTGDLQHQFLATAGTPKKQEVVLQTLLNALGAGVRNGSLALTIDDGNAAAASGTVTCASVLAGDTVTVGGVVFTAVNGGTPTSVQFDMSGTDTATATNLAAAISAHASVGAWVSATSALGVVTITADYVGFIGNGITLASSNGSRLAVSGARLAGGSDPTNGQSLTVKYGV